MTQMLRELQQSHLTVIYTWLSHLHYYITMPYISYLATAEHLWAAAPLARDVQLHLIRTCAVYQKQEK
jgi:hypothetical protein